MVQQPQAAQPGGMYCTSCGAAIRTGVQFCPQCGARTGAAPGAAYPVGSTATAAVGAMCPVCRREVFSDRRFCQWCSQFLMERGRPIRAAGFGRRLGAWLIEGALVFVVLIIAVAVDAAAGTFPLFYMLASLGWLVFVLVLWAQGQSPGKRILGMRVMETSGTPAGFWRMALREIVGKFVSGFVFYLGYLWVIWDKDQQGWHDKIADTVVVAEQ